MYVLSNVEIESGQYIQRVYPPRLNDRTSPMYCTSNKIKERMLLLYLRILRICLLILL